MTTPAETIGINTATGAATATTPSASTVSRIALVDKLKAIMKIEAFEALKEKLDEEVEKEVTAASLLPKGHNNQKTKKTQTEKIKSKAIRWVLKPQIDHIVEKNRQQEQQTTKHKQQDDRDHTESSSSDSTTPAHTDSDTETQQRPNKTTTTATKDLFGRTRKTNKASSSSTTTASRFSTSNDDRSSGGGGSSGGGTKNRLQTQQDLVAELLSTLDEYTDQHQLTKAEQKNAINAFNAAVAFKIIGG